MKLFTLLLIILLATKITAQNIPIIKTTEWNTAGYEGDIPCLSKLRNAVTEFKIDNTGTTDVTTAVQSALNSINNNEVLFFPNGTYKFSNVINVPSNRVIRGESPVFTKFLFTMNADKNMFSMVGTVSTTNVAITAIAAHGGNTFTVASTAGYAVGDDIEIEQDNDPKIHYIESSSDSVYWAQYIKGQIMKIKEINGNVITVDRTFTFDYDIKFSMRMFKITPVTNVGFENFYIKRVDGNTGLTNNNFNFLYVNNCWVRRVYSYNTARYHIRIGNSRNLEIRECEIEMADDCGGGGEGYGALCEEHTGDCLVENNIFHDIRHPLIVKEGASRNVYGYNYSFDIRNNLTCDSDPKLPYADISIHGHYPAYNLFESNIVGRVTSSDSWGPNGPCNTIFRNRVTSANGIWTQSYSHYQTLYANELLAPAKISDNRDKTVIGTLIYANSVDGVIDVTPPNPVENSLYLSSKPEFFGNLPWPGLGYGVTPGTGTIPAKARWDAGESIPLDQLCSLCSIPDLGETKSMCGATSMILKSNVSATNRTFTWYKNNQLIPNQSSKDLTITEAATYKVVADSLGCMNSNQVIVNSIMACNLGSDFNLCNPSMKTLDAGNSEIPNIKYMWSTGATMQTIDVIEAGTYTVTIQAAGCPDASDAVTATSGLLDVTGDEISEPGTVTLSVNGSSTYEWYNAIENGTLLHTGLVYTPTINTSTLFYVEDALGISSNVGKATKNATDGYYNTDNTVKYYFNVLSNLTIDEITVFAEAAQTVVFNFRDASNNLVASVSTAVNAGERVIPINVTLTIGNAYTIDMTGTTGRLWRDKSGNAFPYSIPNVIEIYETFPAYIITNEDYTFWYNWKVTAGNSCDRTPVLAKITGTITSVDAVTQETAISIHPNPVSSFVKIQAMQPDFNTAANRTLSISNTLGQVLISKSIHANETEWMLDLSQLNRGIYFIQIDNQTRKIIKQ